MKKNNAGTEEVIDIFLSEEKFPIAFKAKVDELVGQGWEEAEAREWIPKVTFQMELYYSVDQGLFMVEAEAVESIAIFNPYSGDELEECEDSIIEQADSNYYCCPKCGSTDVHIKAWVGLNTSKYIGTAEEERIWCPHCEKHFEPVTVEEFKTDGPTEEEGEE